MAAQAHPGLGWLLGDAAQPRDLSGLRQGEGGVGSCVRAEAPFGILVAHFGPVVASAARLRADEDRVFIGSRG